LPQNQVREALADLVPIPFCSVGALLSDCPIALHQWASPLVVAQAGMKHVELFLDHHRAWVALDVYTHPLGGTDGDMARRLERLLD
jgi:hypothetical protein